MGLCGSRAGRWCWSNGGRSFPLWKCASGLAFEALTSSFPDRLGHWSRFRIVSLRIMMLYPLVFISAAQSHPSSAPSLESRRVAAFLCERFHFGRFSLFHKYQKLSLDALLA